MGFTTETNLLKSDAAFGGYSGATAQNIARDQVTAQSTGIWRCDYTIPVTNATPTSYFRLKTKNSTTYLGASSTCYGGANFVISGTGYFRITTVGPISLEGIGCGSAFPNVSIVKIAELE